MEGVVGWAGVVGVFPSGSLIFPSSYHRMGQGRGLGTAHEPASIALSLLFLPPLLPLLCPILPIHARPGSLMPPLMEGFSPRG